MHDLLFRFLVSVLLFSFPIFSIERINLSEDCKDQKKHIECSFHPWYVIDKFSDNLTHLENEDKGWKLAEKIPLTPEIYFPGAGSSVFTMRTKFDAPSDYLSNRSFPGLYFISLGEVYSVYLNGTFVYGDGKSENGKIITSRYGRNVLIPLSSRLFKEKDNILVIKTEGTPGFGATGIYTGNTVYIGDYKEIAESINDKVGLALIFLYIFTGGYHFFLYLKRRAEVYNLYFTILSISASLYFLNRVGFFYEYGMDSLFSYRLELLSAYCIFPSIVAFMETLFFGKLSRLIKGVSIFFSIIALATLISPPPVLNLLLMVWQFTILLGVIYTFHIFYRAIRQKSESAKRLLFGFIVLIIFSVFDIFDSMFLRTGFHFARYAFFAFVTGIAVLLANRFLNLYETIEDLNSSLEKKVEIRTQELQMTLDQVRLLKEQQDGDYFLTTLIIQPLATNAASDERVGLDVLVRQKKKFEFKKRIHEIGGDICISDIITLQGRKYTVFINGDAMGKSIQGAGGAIVLGVVFKSIISRTIMYQGNQAVYPERWLKLAFIELQKVFESFDGSMLVSIVIGLIDNECGYLYFINAEHPWSVLYRDAKASFLESGLNLRKVGMLGIEGSLHIKTFQMNKNDIIFIGSDGRDDIQLGEDETGRRIINENENLFLQTIEDAEGQLEKILALTEKKGEITDDFSLLKIRYMGTDSKILNEKPEFMQESIALLQKDRYEEVLLTLDLHKNDELGEYAGEFTELVGKTVSAVKNYRAGVNILNEFHLKHPEDEEAAYLLATYFYLLKDFQRAADLGEILKLRHPEDAKILRLLVEIYTASGNIIRAQKILSGTP